MITEADRAAIHTSIDALSPQSLSVVSQVIRAINAPAHAVISKDSWLATPEWADGFTARIRAHHALSREPLSTTQFEAAFELACQNAGWDVESATSATQRFYDTRIRIPGERPKSISLKASSAKDMRRNWIHISKLTEAAWIQDARKQADRRNNLIDLFSEYRQYTDLILMLRAFRTKTSVTYELSEIPTSLFIQVGNLSIEDAQQSTIPIPAESAVPDFKIRVDRSDAKITLTGIQLEKCVVHGSWELKEVEELFAPSSPTADFVYPENVTFPEQTS